MCHYVARDEVRDDGDDEVPLPDGRGPERQEGRTEVSKGQFISCFLFLSKFEKLLSRQLESRLINETLMYAKHLYQNGPRRRNFPH